MLFSDGSGPGERAHYNQSVHGQKKRTNQPIHKMTKCLIRLQILVIGALANGIVFLSHFLYST